MKKTLQRCEGVITIFVSIMLLGVLSLGTMVIELGRLAAAKTQLSDASLSAATSMIAGYNIDLYDSFGILAMDTDKATPARCRDYMEFNSDLSPSYRGSHVTRLYSLESVEFSGIYNLTNPALLQRQILTQAKYNIVPEDFSLNLYNVDWLLGDVKEICTSVQEGADEIASAGRSGDEADLDDDAKEILSSLRSTFAGQDRFDASCNSSVEKGMLPSVTGAVADAQTADDSAVIGGLLGDAYAALGGTASALNRTSSTPKTLADASADVGIVDTLDRLNTLDWGSASAVHELAGQIAEETADLAQQVKAALEVASAEQNDNLLLNAYAVRCFSNRNDTLVTHSGPARNSGFSGGDSNFVSACAEYLFAADASETNAQESAWEYLFALRYLDNLGVILQQDTMDKAKDYSVLQHFAWAYYESCLDMKVLADGNGTLPFHKDSLTIPYLSADEMRAAFGSGSVENALSALGVYNGSEFAIGGDDPMTYRDSLMLALYLVPDSKKLARMADLMQLEIRYKQRYVTGHPVDFLMQNENTYCRVRAQARLNSVLPVIAQGSNGNMGSLRFSSIQYTGY